MLTPVVLHGAVCRTLGEASDGLRRIRDGEVLLRDVIKKLTHASRLTCQSEIRHYAVTSQLADMEEEFAKRAAITGEIYQYCSNSKVWIEKKGK